MTTASLLLLVIGLLGAFDVAYFHHHIGRLAERRECRREVALHVARGVVYAAQFALVPNLRFHGAWLAALGALYAADVAVAWADVLEENRSRKAQGGLPRGEYFMHVVLSVLVGAYLREVALQAEDWIHRPTAIVVAGGAPAALRIALGALAVGSLGSAVLEAFALALPARPRPVHVAVRLATTIERLWDVTQDHHEHPNWDHRFSRITMLDGRIATGTEMLYEKQVAFFTVRGWGRYKLHRLLRQSTFEFGSESPLSLIRRGVGLWLYRPAPGGRVDFATSYTYEVRWGTLGRVVDHFVFRPWFQRETERSFRRLVARHFRSGASSVTGARGTKPIRPLDLEQPALA